jgi:hypothetical protein
LSPIIRKDLNHRVLRNIGNKIRDIPPDVAY